MNRLFILTAFASLALVSVAEDKVDTTHVVKLDEVVVSSLKETSPRQTPVSSTVLATSKINAAQITSVRDLSGIVPNFFIPD